MKKKNLIFGIRSSLENYGLLTYEDAGVRREVAIIPLFAIGRLTKPTFFKSEL